MVCQIERMLTLALSAVILLQAVSAQQQTAQDRIACRSLRFANRTYQFDTSYLSACEVLPEDSVRCNRVTCSNTDSSRLISTFTITTVNCAGADGRTPGMLVTIVDFSSQILLNKTFLTNETVTNETVTIDPDNLQLIMFVTPRPVGISFEINRARDTFNAFFTQEQFYWIDYTEYNCPSVPGLQQPASTCSALSTLQGADEWFGGECTVNPSCTAVRCFVTSNIVTYNALNIFPCANPPAVRILISESGIIPHIDATVTQTTSGIPYYMNLLGTLNVVLEWSNDGTSFDISVTRVPTWFFDPSVILISRQTVPISTSACPPAPTQVPTQGPTEVPTEVPTQGPILVPTEAPTQDPTQDPTQAPTQDQTLVPTQGLPVSDGSVRLTYGSSDSIGRLEVFLDGAWGTVCDRDGLTFSHEEGSAACRQLGYGQAAYTGSSQLYTSSTPPTDLPIVMTDVYCTSGATRLQSCTFSRSTGGCTHSNDVGVQCSTCQLYLCDDGQCTQAVACDGTAECNDGSDENDIVCTISRGLSNAIKIAIGVGVTILVLLIVIPVSICVCVCVCMGACAAKAASSSGPRTTQVVANVYSPVPKTLNPVV